jgi:hypothetical protein
MNNVTVKTITAYNLYDFVTATCDLYAEGYRFVDKNLCIPRNLGVVLTAVMAKGIDSPKRTKLSVVIKDSDPSVYGLVPAAVEAPQSNDVQEPVTTPAEAEIVADSSIQEGADSAEGDASTTKRRGRKPSVTTEQQ